MKTDAQPFPILAIAIVAKLQLSTCRKSLLQRYTRLLFGLEQ